MLINSERGEYWGCFFCLFGFFFYQNIYPKICACAWVDLDGVNFLTFAIVFPVPGGSAEHNLFSQPVVIWFFGNSRMKSACKD